MVELSRMHGGREIKIVIKGILPWQCEEYFLSDLVCLPGDIEINGLTIIDLNDGTWLLRAEKHDVRYSLKGRTLAINGEILIERRADGRFFMNEMETAHLVETLGLILEERLA